MREYYPTMDLDELEVDIIVKYDGSVMQKSLIKFVIDHLKTFKAYPLEFEYKNKVYDYKTIMKTINNRKQ